MLHIGLFCAIGFGSEVSETLPQTAFVAPWEIQLMQVDDNCHQLCTEWSALYFSSEHGCTGNVVDGNISFCPDTEAVEQWTVEQELEYEGMHPHREELEVFEREVLDGLTSERAMKLSVHPWKNLPVTGPVAERSYSVGTDSYTVGSSRSFTCYGGNWGRYATSSSRGRRPQKLYVRSERFINWLTFYYPYGRYVRGGGRGGRGTLITLPRCVNVVFLRTGSWIDAVWFIGNGQATRLYGGNGGGVRIIMAPSGKCLGDIQLRYGTYVSRICVKFNGVSR